MLPYWLAAIHLPNIGPQKIMRWLKCVPSIKTLFSLTKKELLALGMAAADAESIQSVNWEEVEKAEKWSQLPGNHLLTIQDADYPAQLKEIHSPPLVLFLQGNKTLLSEVHLAIVGSRHASYAGIETAHLFGKHLASAGFVVTSGLALGIDASAHRGALAANGLTLGVAGTGLAHCYPRQNKSLVEAMLMNNGAILSEFPLSVGPLACNFPRRNRIISGLSKGVLLVEAALKSGSLITAQYALEQGREVFAIPGSIHTPRSKGCHYLIRQGAKLVETAQDILEELQHVSHSLPKATPEPAVPAELSPVFEQITHEITPIDVIILRSGLTTSELSSILLTLELDGYIQAVPGGYIRTIAKQ